MQVFLVFLAFFFAGSAFAADPFMIDNINADRAASNPTQARNLAIEDAQRQGFELLLKRITAPEVRAGIPRLTDQGITAMVRSFEILQEKITGNRYQARFAILYNEAQVRNFLSQNKVEVIEVKSPPILVLPMLVSGSETMLWEDNPWRGAWQQLLNELSDINLIMPLGDSGDVRAIKAEDLKAQNFDALLEFANKYGGQEALVAEAFFVKNGTELVVRLQPVGPSPTLEFLSDYRFILDANSNEYWGQAAKKIRDKIREQWLGRKNYLGQVTGKNLKVIVALENGREWIDMRNRLEGVSEISEMSVVELAQKRAVIEVGFAVPLSIFQESLAKRGLELLQGDDLFVIRKKAGDDDI